MGKYFFKKDDEDQQNNFDNEITQDINAEEADGYEQYVPFYDEDDGEYKYLPADTSDAEEEEEVVCHQVSHTDLPSKNILDKIEFLDNEVKNSNKKTEENKISKLNEEIKNLKEQLFQIKTTNEMKRQFEEFKKEFLENQTKNNNNNNNNNNNYNNNKERKYNYEDDLNNRYRDYKTSDYNGNKFNQDIEHRDYMPANARPTANEDIDKLVNKVKKEIYQEKEFDSGKIINEIEKLNKKSISEQDIIDKINVIVEERLISNCDLIISKISEKLEQRLGDIKKQNIVMFNEMISKAYEKDDTGFVKIDELIEQFNDFKESTKNVLQEYNSKQNDIIVRFSETAEKLEPKNVIDTDNLLAETMLDNIGDIKTDITNAVKDTAILKEDNKQLKDSVLTIINEIEFLKDNMSKTFSDSSDYQYKVLSTKIENIEDNLNAFIDGNQSATEEIKQAVNSAFENFNPAKNLSDFKEDFLKEYQATSEKTTLEIKNDISSVSVVSQDLINGLSTLKEHIDLKVEKTETDTATLTELLNNFKENTLEINDKNYQSIENISQNLETFKENITNSTQRIKESISESFDQIKEHYSISGNSINKKLEEQNNEIINTNTLIARKYDEIARMFNEFASLKTEIADVIGIFKDSVKEEIQNISNDINKSNQSNKEQIAAVLEEELYKTNEAVNTEIEKVINRIDDVVKASDNSVNAMEGLGISVDSLLRQAEENVAAQSAISINIEAVNAQLNGILNKTDDLAEKSDRIAADIEEHLIIFIKEKLEEIAKKVENSPQKANEFKILSDKIKELKNMIVSLQNTDLNFELSSIFSEIRKLNSKNENQDCINNNLISADIKNLRNQLDDISKIDNAKEKGKK